MTRKVELLLMEDILHLLIGILSHSYRVLYIPGGAEFLPSTVVFGAPHIAKKVWLARCSDIQRQEADRFFSKQISESFQRLNGKDRFDLMY